MTKLPATLTDSDREWINHHLALANRGFTLPQGVAPKDAAAGEGGRFYLSCGHQMGGPQGYAPSECPTCLDFLTEVAAQIGLPR